MLYSHSVIGIAGSLGWMGPLGGFWCCIGTLKVR